jgi:uncharacterized membrane protein YfcA
MSGEMQFYLVAVPAVILFGLSKGGFSGLSSLAMPILSLVASPVRAAAIVAPILIAQDWVSVWAFRRHFSSRNLIILVPSSMIGVALGWLLAARVSDDAVRLAIGVISIVFVAYMLIPDRLGRAPAEKPGRSDRGRMGIARRIHQFHQPFRSAAVPSRAGLWLVRRVSTDRFYAVILALTFLIGVKIDL